MFVDNRTAYSGVKRGRPYVNNGFTDRFSQFLRGIGKECHVPYAESIIIADADKCEGYRLIWEKNGIPYEHGVMIYLVTKMAPYNKEARVTISPCDFVIKYYEQFRGVLP